MYKALSSSCAADGVRKMPGPLRDQQSMDWTLQFVHAPTQTTRRTEMGLSGGAPAPWLGYLGGHTISYSRPRWQGGEIHRARTPQHSLHYCSHCQTWVSSSLFAELLLVSLLCRYFNYADMFLDSFKYVYYLLIRP